MLKTFSSMELFPSGHSVYIADFAMYFHPHVLGTTDFFRLQVKKKKEKIIRLSSSFSLIRMDLRPRLRLGNKIRVSFEYRIFLSIRIPRLDFS